MTWKAQLHDAAQSDPEGFVSAFGLTPRPGERRRLWDQLYGPCPRCNKRALKLAGKGDGVAFYCHGCARGGDVIELVGWLIGADPQTPSGLAAIHDAGAGKGLCAARSWTPPRSARRPREGPPPPRCRPPRGELDALWGAAVAVTADAAVRHYLEAERGLDGAALAGLDVVRALPRGEEPALAWWPGSWRERWRVGVLAVEADGTPASVQARALGDDPPKTRWPLSCAAAGLLFADPLARSLLRGEETEVDAVVLCEGLTDFLRAVCEALPLHRHPSRPRTVAVLAAASGGFSCLSQVSLPPSLPVYLATDADSAGERYAAAAARALPGRPLYRVLLGPAADGTPRDLDAVLREQPGGLTALLEGARPWNEPESDTEGEPEDARAASSAAAPPDDDRAEAAWRRLVGRGPRLSEAYDVAALRRDRSRGLLSLARLPPWPGGGPKEGHGWGADLDRLLGGGVCPGYVLAIGAARAGGGKTAWMMQPVEGLALRNVELLAKGLPGPLTPVVLLSEMSARDLSWRSLARWTGFDSRIFRAGADAASLGVSRDEVDRAWHAAEGALQGELGRGRSWIWPLPLRTRGRALLDEITAHLADWRSVLAATHPGRAIWPVVVFDPLQRALRPGAEPIAALSELAEALKQRADEEGWIVFLTSDTTKAAASGLVNGKSRKGPPRGSYQWAAAIFRGSYGLQHAVDAALVLYNPTEQPGVMAAAFAKNRWGSIPHNPTDLPRWTWSPQTGRFTAGGLTASETSGGAHGARPQSTHNDGIPENER